MAQRKMLSCLVTVACVLLAGFERNARADALVVTQAMKASTIAEIFVEHDRVRLEIEVGQQDLTVFQNILPDAAYKKLTGGSRPLAERKKAFVESDWQIRADTRLLDGSISEIAVGKRVVRDEVTGQPLAEQSTDVASVIRISVVYALVEQPKVLTIRPPMSDGNVAANIGFVCYHKGLPVNDFRYLPGEVSLSLDWQDPWYSEFRNRNLARQFDAPMSAYLYVEPYEVRKEIIVRPQDLQTWVDLGLEDATTIPVATQEKLKREIAEFLSERNPVMIDGRIAKGELDRIHFIRRTLRTTGIVEPPVALDATSATLGVIFVYPLDSLPQEVAMRWELFTPKIQTVPAVASDEAGGLPAEITPENPVLEWKNYLTRPTSSELRAVGGAPIQQRMQIPLLSMLCGCVAMGSVGLLLKQKMSGCATSKPALITFVCAVLGGMVLLPVAEFSIPTTLASTPQLSTSEGRELLATLLYNVYRSFDHHDESLIYDRLSQSIAGDLLSDVYLETRKSMEVKNQGGLRVSVKEVDVLDLDYVDTTAEGSTFQCRWRVSGSIGHWGHIHRRENEHVARITVAPRDQRWKITNMEVLDEQALEPSRQLRSEDGAGA